MCEVLGKEGRLEKKRRDEGKNVCCRADDTFELLFCYFGLVIEIEKMKK